MTPGMYGSKIKGKIVLKNLGGWIGKVKDHDKGPGAGA